MRPVRRFFTLLTAVGFAGATLQTTLVSAEPPERTTTFLVTFKDGTDPDSGARGMRANGWLVRNVYRNLFPGVAVDIPESSLPRLKSNPDIERIETDSEVTTFDTRSNATWGLDRSDQRTLPLDGTFSHPSAAGSGAYVYVIDTGVRSTHADFGGRVAGGTTYVNDGFGTEDCNGHGTHVAGTVAGGTYGLAPRATVVPVRVLDCAGSGSWSGVIAGLDYVAGDTTRRPAVANLSLGGGANTTADDAVNRAVNAGVTVVVAAGNSNADACNTSPARTPAALTVGATTSTDDRSSFSNYGRCLDLFAPGSAITSAWYNGDTATNTISGTSMASPHVAGAVAQLLGRSPSLTPVQVAAQVTAAATADVVRNAGALSPNRLLYADPGSSETVVPPPANDAFAAAETISLGGSGPVPGTMSGSGTLTGSTVRAGREAGEPAHAGNGGGASVWYTFTAPSDGEVSLTTEGSSFDTILGVYTGGSVDALTEVVANDDSPGGTWSAVTVTATAGSRYLVAVDGYNGVSGSVKLNWAQADGVTITSVALPAGGVGEPYRGELTAGGGYGGFSWSLAGGSLPAGLELSTGGVISGTPTAAGSSAFTVSVTDGITSATAATSIDVVAPVSITTSVLPGGTVGRAYLSQLVGAGGSGGYVWSLAGGALPAGLVMSPEGTITGTPTAAGTTGFTVQATDTAGRTAARDLAITVANVPAPAAFNKLKPSANAQNVSRTPTFTWAAASGATSYEVCVSTTAACSPTSSGWRSAGSGTSITWTALNAKTAYYWQVRAVNAGGATPANNGTWWKVTTVR